MKQIFSKEDWESDLERIENMTVKEIRSHLAPDAVFAIYGDEHWAVLKEDKNI